MKYSSNGYNITRAVTIAFNALRNAVVWSNLRKLYYNIQGSNIMNIMKSTKNRVYDKVWLKKYQGVLS